MKTSFLAFAAFAVAVDAATHVAVLEFGKGGAVRRTLSKNSRTTVNGVTSFWDGVHSRDMSRPQPAGMTVVPDLFNKPEGGLVLGVTNVNLGSMPSTSKLVDSEGDGVVGHMTVEGSKCHKMLETTGGAQPVTTSNLVTSAKREATSEGLSSLSIVVDSENAASVDEQLQTLITSLKKQAAESDSTFVLHLVVEEQAGAERRRRLDEVEAAEEERNLEEDAAEDGNDDGAANDNNQNGYYGYGYYDANGVWTTPYKTMFQIQYFNIVLWTAVGLFVVLAFSIFLVTDMPLEADTLLFGESAKMMGSG